MGLNLKERINNMNNKVIPNDYVYKCNNCNLIVCISIIKLPFFCRRCKKCKSKLELIERNVFDFWRK